MLARLLLSRGCKTLQTVRSVHISPCILGGHVPVPDPHIPQPQKEHETDLFGRKRVARITQDSHEHSSSDYSSYFGGALFVALTIGAVAFYTDTWGMNIKKDFKHSHHKTFAKPKTAEPEPEPVVVSPKKEEKKSAPPSTEESETASPKESHPSTSGTAPSESSSSDSPSSDESSESKYPSSIEYLLVGSGTAAYYAALAIRARQAEAKVLIIGEEDSLPYNRPPLSKELWWYGTDKSQQTFEYKGLSGKNRDVFYEAEGFFVPPSSISSSIHGGVSLVKGVKVVRLDVDTKTAYLNDGNTIKYNKCLLATGGKPKRIDVLEDVKEDVVYFRKLSDFQRVHEACSKGKTVTVVGGGFLGSELAYSIKRKYPDATVDHILRNSAPLSDVLPSYLSNHAKQGLLSMGVNLLGDCQVKKAEKTKEGRISLSLSDSSSISTDLVVVAAGIEPDAEVGQKSNIKMDSLGGFSSNSTLSVCPGVWCAGDACAYDSGVLGRRRVEHWENAQITGRLAGENMTGGEKKFWYQPSFFTKISPDLHLNAVGNTDAKLHTVSVYAKQTDDFPNKYHKGVVFYSDSHKKIVGCVLVNVYGVGVDVARRLIDEGQSIDNWKQLSKLFSLYQSEEPSESVESKEKAEK